MRPFCRFAAMSSAFCVLTVTVFARTVPIATPDEAPTLELRDLSFRDVRDRALEAMEAGRFEESAALYDELAQRNPDPVLTYNRGLAEYKAGQFDKAVESMTAALEQSSSTELLERGAFNLGRMAQDRATMASPVTPGAPGMPPVPASDPGLSTALDAADTQLGRLLEQYRWQLDNAQSDDALRARGELAHDLRETIRQIRGQMPEGQSGESSSDPQDEEGDSQNQPQNQPSDENQDQSQNQGQEPQNQPGNQEQNQEQNQDQSQEQGQEQNQDQSQQTQPPQPSEGAPGAEGSESGAAADQPDDAMSADEVQRLLQRIRDKEKERRATLRDRARARFQPVDKDW
jgi:Ca-activated chloride channel family protein